MYRQATLQDLERLNQLGKISYKEYSKVLTSDHWNTLSTILNDKKNIENLIKIGTVFICETSMDIIGMIYFIPSGNPTELYQSDWCYIRFLGVHPKYRNYGIGKKLVDLCLIYARKTSREHTIALHTSEFMHTARLMYEKLGFEKVKEIERLGKKYWVYLMNIE